MGAPPLLLTLRLDPESFARLDGWRREYFPVHRNFLPAHLTLFHNLPPIDEDAIRARLRELCAAQGELPLHFFAPKFFGRGVALEARASELVALRTGLAREWIDRLIPQDRQPFKPHVTIQNKDTPERAREVLEIFRRDFRPFDARGTGLLLWEYLGGPWRLVEELAFADSTGGTGL